MYTDERYHQVLNLIQSTLVCRDLYEETENQLNRLSCTYQKEMGVWQIKNDSLKLAIQNVKAETDSLDSEKKLFLEKIEELSS